MLLPAVTGLGEPVIVIPTTAEVTTGVVTVAECGLVESDGLETVAVSVMCVPAGVLAVTCTTTVNVADAPAARVGAVPVIVPVRPTGGVVKVNVGPLFWVSETNVVFPGTPSVSCTLWASLGPLLVTVMM